MTTTERKEWLRQRQQGLGGTDMASICGAGFHTAAEVFEEKIAPEPIDRPPTDLMRMGVATEDFNAQLYAEKTGAELVSPGLVRSEIEPWAFATLDRSRVDVIEGLGTPVELKYTPFFSDAWGPDGSDEIRDGYTIQATWEAFILRSLGHDVTRTDVAVLAGSGEHRIFHVPYDPQLGEMLLLLGRAFWACVEKRSGVEGWQHPLLDTITEKLQAIHPETATDLGPSAWPLVEEIDSLTLTKQAGEEAEDRIKFLKKQLAAMLGGFEVGRLPDGRRVKQYPVAAKLITPAPYEREARVDVRILKAPTGKKAGAR